MSDKNNRTSQVSVLLSKEERQALAKSSNEQGRSISQIARIAILKHLKGEDSPTSNGIIQGSIEELFTNLGRQLAKNTEILNNLQLVLFDTLLQGSSYVGTYVTDNVVEITGYDKTDILDLDFVLSRVHPQERKTFIQQNKDGIRKGSWQVSFRFKLANGHYARTLLACHLNDANRVYGCWLVPRTELTGTEEE